MDMNFTNDAEQPIGRKQSPAMAESSASPPSPLQALLPESRTDNDAEEPLNQSFVSSEPASNEEDAPASAPDPLSQRMNRKPPLEDLARGISCVMGPVMNSFDAGVEGCLKSQGILASSIDRLSRELDKLLEDAPVPFAIQHATKLSSVQSRVASLSASLRVIQKRMDNINVLLAGYAVKAKQIKVQSTSHIPSAMAAELVYDGDTVDKDLHVTLFSKDQQHTETSMEAGNIPKDQESTNFDAKNESSLDGWIDKSEVIGSSGPDESSHFGKRIESEHDDSTSIMKDVDLDTTFDKEK